jgi:hypothetical protein
MKTGPKKDIFKYDSVTDLLSDVFDRLIINVDTGKLELKPDGITSKVVFDPNAGVTVTGLSTNLVAKTADYTATASDSVITADGSSSTVTITLPTAVGITGREYRIKCIDDTNAVKVNTTSSQTIDGAVEQVLSRWDMIVVISDGTNWIIG